MMRSVFASESPAGEERVRSMTTPLDELWEPEGPASDNVVDVWDAELRTLFEYNEALK